MRMSYDQLKFVKKTSLKESLKPNGSLEDFDAEDLVAKAFNNKYATNSVREFKDKLLYINVDPNFIFGTRNPEDKIWISVTEIDKNTNAQNRIYIDSALDEAEASEMLSSWKDLYIMDSDGDVSTDEEK